MIGKLVGNNCAALSTSTCTQVIHKNTTNKVFYTGLPIESSNPLLHWLLTLIWDSEKALDAVFMSKTVDYDTWHFCMAHASKEVMSHMETHLKGVQIKGTSHLKVCKGCEMGKHVSKSYPSSDKRTTIILHLIHADWIELPVQSYHGYKFIINFLDDYSSYAYSELLKTKDTAFVAFKKFKAITEKKTGKKIKEFRIDRGGEFLNGEFKHFLNEIGRAHV